MLRPETCLVAPPRTMVVASSVKHDLFSALSLFSHLYSLVAQALHLYLPALHHVFLHHVHECAAFTQEGHSSNTK